MHKITTTKRQRRQQQQRQQQQQQQQQLRTCSEAAILAISGPSKLSRRLMYSITRSRSALMAVRMSRFCRFLFSEKSEPW